MKTSHLQAFPPPAPERTVSVSTSDRDRPALLLRQQIGLIGSRLRQPWSPFGRRRLQRFYARFVKPGALCFDVGAHIGLRTQTWLERGAHVVSIEPQLACIRFLERRFGQQDSWALVEAAAGTAVGTGTFQVDPLHPTTSALTSTTDAEARLTQQVPTTTLDHLIEQHGVPHYCEISITATADQVLQGLSQPISTVAFAYAPEHQPSALACLHQLQALGTYEFNYATSDTFHLAYYEWLSAEEMKAFLAHNTLLEPSLIVARRRG